MEASMPVKPVPEGFHTVTPYLIVPGVAKLIEFLKQAFGAKEDHRTTLPDGRVMHAQVKVGDSFVMMGEPAGDWKPMPASLHLYVPDADAWYRRAMQAGAVSVMEPSDQFYGDRMGGIKDPGGNLWWIATHKEDVPPEEIKRRSAEAAKQRQQK
jgi:PhnB protein